MPRLRRRSPYPSRFFLLVVLLACLAVSGCGQGDADKEKAAAKAPAAPAVMVAAKKPVVADVPVTAEFVGRLAAKENIEVRARVEGFLDEQAYKDGADVKKGQLLFVIQPEPYEAKLQEAKASLMSQQAGLRQAEIEARRQLAAEQGA